ncbi:MAG: YicC family protein [Tepidanaerobacter acetatoxydans]|uniref:YicC/YloC family endoribonuclease n=1 Tax=Tepidanaerobacter TaxID=499228 RepID=UPI000B02DC28|nr:MULTISPECIES: YicC/YloC family endoribonuclease [Tepidanaerobacter]NLU09946.1 YicC family protein [Tepidanaerobacter acetatoxydans]
MIKSMTGYGRGENIGKYHWIVEIRSVNHRFLDIFVRLPKPWLFLEEKVKNYIKGKIVRGRIDVFINLYNENVPVNIKIDKTLVNNYYKKLIELKDEIGFEGPISLSLLSLMPNIFNVEEEFPTEQELWDTLVPPIDDALENLFKMREKEGENLWKDLYKRLEIIKNRTQLIEERAKVVPAEYRKKLMFNLEQLCSDISLDQQRIEMEVALFAEKACITEEIVRLNSHLDQMKELVNSEEAVGRKMDFIAQEMFREVNTIAAKSLDCGISKEVIEIKSELEKIREQIQNIE